MAEVPRQPVMADVAARAGVSHQTVSRVVNNHPSVRAATRARVTEVIAELGYRPNTAARTLVTRQSRSLGVISARPSEYGPARVLLGLEAAARAAGYAVTVTIVGGAEGVDDVDAGAMAAAVAHLGDQGVAGIAVIAPQDAAGRALGAVRTGVPLVRVGTTGGLAACEDLDQSAAAAAATRHLLGLGHRRVAHVAGPQDWQEARSRLAGWQRELAAHGLRADPPRCGDWSPASGYEAGRWVAAQRCARGGAGGVTAVFAANDQMALGVVRALADAGLSVPGDVSVVGFDDVPEAAYLSPPLTTVRQDFAELGRRCLRVLLGHVHGDAPRLAPMEHHLVVRSSTAAPGV